MLEMVYKDDAGGKSQVYEQFVRLKNGDMSIEDNPLSGRPSTARFEKIGELVLTDLQLTVHQLTESSELSKSSVQ